MSFGDLEALCDRVAGRVVRVGIWSRRPDCRGHADDSRVGGDLSGDHQGRLRGGGYCRQFCRPPDRRPAANRGGQGRFFTQDVILRGGARVAAVPALGRRGSSVGDCIAGSRRRVDGNVASRRSALGTTSCKLTLYRRPWPAIPTRRPMSCFHRALPAIPRPCPGPMSIRSSAAQTRIITKMSTRAMWWLGRLIWAG